jgi:hypothetical protein
MMEGLLTQRRPVLPAGGACCSPPLPARPAQVDRKFIMMTCGGVLVALDQHAADERVRLEALQAALQQPGPQRAELLGAVGIRPAQVRTWVEAAAWPCPAPAAP